MTIRVRSRRPTLHRIFTVAFLFLVTLLMSAQWATSQEEGGVPAFNAGAPPKGTKLPPILGKDQLWGADAQSPYQTHAYDLAAEIPTVLHQQPCYCYCDRMGHNSLPRGSVCYLPQRGLLFLPTAQEG